MRQRVMFRGSFTVEAALIFPFIFIIIINLLYMAFCLHDQVVLQCAVDETLQMYNRLLVEPTTLDGAIEYEGIYNKSLLSQQLIDNTEIEHNCYKEIRDKVQGRLMISDVTAFTVDKTYTSITGGIKSVPRMSLPIIYQYIPFTSGIEAKAKVSIHTPADFIRIAEQMIAGVLSTKEGNQLKEGIQKLMESIY